MAKRRLVKSIAWSLSLVASTVILIGLIETSLPYSPLRDRITDTLEIPALWILSLFFPQGIHTGSGVRYWAYYAFATNLGVYTLFWYLCFNFTRYLLVRKSKNDSESKEG